MTDKTDAELDEANCCTALARCDACPIHPNAISALRKQLDEAREREAQMAAALRDIAESDDIDNVLDPARNKRVASAALSQEPPASHAPGMRDAEKHVWDEVSKKARSWAAIYSDGSDGRNTFVLFAEWAEGRAAKEPQP